MTNETSLTPPPVFREFDADESLEQFRARTEGWYEAECQAMARQLHDEYLSGTFDVDEPMKADDFRRLYDDWDRGGADHREYVKHQAIAALAQWQERGDRLAKRVETRKRQGKNLFEPEIRALKEARHAALEISDFLDEHEPVHRHPMG